MSNKKIMSDYEHNQALLKELMPRVKMLIEILGGNNNVELHEVQARVKEKSSLQKKIEKKKGKYNDLKDITDIVGIRIITYFNDDVDKMAGIIEEEFKIDPKNSIDKRVIDPERFGYSSLHYVVEFTPERLSLIEYEEFSGIKFEIQIRSILQHAWAEIEHDLGYKSKNEVPKEIRRDFSRVAGLLEIADNEFIRIKKFLENYTREVEMKIGKESLEILIDKVTLNEYIEKSPIVLKIYEYICKYYSVEQLDEHAFSLEEYIKALKFFDISTISQLDLILKDTSQKIIKFFMKWTNEGKGEDPDIILKDIVLFYLFYVLVYEDYSDEKTEKYTSIMFDNILIQEQIQELLQKMLDENFTL